MANLTQAGVTFGNGQVLTKDPVRLMTEQLGLSNKNLNPSGSNYVWNVNLSGRNGRGVYYNDYHIPQGDSYGNIIGWTYGGQNKITVTNYSDSNMRINVIGGIYDNTDDAWRYYVVRDGSAVSPTQHSGGTVIIDSGSQAQGPVGPYTTTTTQDISANSSATFWLYASVLYGSNYDALRPYLASTFNSWI